MYYGRPHAISGVFKPILNQRYIVMMLRREGKRYVNVPGNELTVSCATNRTLLFIGEGRGSHGFLTHVASLNGLCLIRSQHPMRGQERGSVGRTQEQTPSRGVGGQVRPRGRMPDVEKTIGDVCKYLQ